MKTILMVSKHFKLVFKNGRGANNYFFRLLKRNHVNLTSQGSRSESKHLKTVLNYTEDFFFLKKNHHSCARRPS